MNSFGSADSVATPAAGLLSRVDALIDLLVTDRDTTRAFVDRTRRLEEHLGESLGDPRKFAHLTMALRAIRVFPEVAGAEVTP